MFGASFRDFLNVSWRQCLLVTSHWKSFNDLPNLMSENSGVSHIRNANSGPDFFGS